MMQIVQEKQQQQQQRLSDVYEISEFERLNEKNDFNRSFKFKHKEKLDERKNYNDNDDDEFEQLIHKKEYHFVPTSKAIVNTNDNDPSVAYKLQSNFHYAQQQTELELRSREALAKNTILTMSNGEPNESDDNNQADYDEFSSMKLYKSVPPTSSTSHHKYNKRMNNYYRLNNSDHSNDEEEDDEDEALSEKYCCECPCCRCPWPIPKGVWCVKDVCGIVCATVTWSLLLFAEFVIVFVIILPFPFTISNFLHTVIFHILLFLAFASHWATMFTDPGVVPLGNATPENIEKMTKYPGQIIYRCPRCLSIKPLRAHHCSVCKRCVRKMDHHCPW